MSDKIQIILNILVKEYLVNSKKYMTCLDIYEIQIGFGYIGWYNSVFRFQINCPDLCMSKCTFS